MAIYVVRHAKAGDPSRWVGDDELRPLNKRGRRQAEHLAERFAAVPVSRVLSSPYLRCTQTVQPIADGHAVTLEPDPMLAYAGSFLDIVELLVQLPDHAVTCSHGDVIPDVIAALYRRGMDVVGTEDWRKGTTWVLQREGDTFTSAEVWPPPADD